MSQQIHPLPLGGNIEIPEPAWKPLDQLASQLGFWASVVAAIGSLGFSVAALLDLGHLLAFPWNHILIFAPSLLLAIAFLLVMVSIYHYAPIEQKLWSHIGLIFATMYATLNSLVYIVQLAVVIPHETQGNVSDVAFLEMNQGSFMEAINAIAYSLMSLSTLFASVVFVGSRLKRSIRYLFIANGLLAPIILLILAFRGLLPIGALWIITLPFSMILLAIFFYRVRTKATHGDGKK